MNVFSTNEWFWLAQVLLLPAIAGLLKWRALMVFAFAALCVALLLAVVPADWVLQASMYCVALFLSGVVYLRYFRVPATRNATDKIQRRPHRLVGMHGSLLVATTAGRSRMQLKDGIWPVQCEEKLPRGALVEVTGFSGKVLDVAPLKPGSLAHYQ